MSFHEKSAWVCFVSIGVVFAPYFGVVLRHPMAYVGLFGLAVIGLVVLLTLFHLVNALVTRSIRRSGEVPSLDELDRMVELRAAKTAGLVLAFVVVVWSLAAMIGIPAAGVSQRVHASATGESASAAGFVIPVAHAMTAVHLLFAGFVIANLVYYGRIVVAYRRLARG